MSILLDTPDCRMDALRAICARKQLSQAVGRALASYIDANRAAYATAFGLWADRKLDGLAYQQKLRSEW